MSELEFFHSSLYKENNSHSSSFLEDLKEVPTLTEELRKVCEGRIEYNECFNVLKSFPKNKTTGNVGLTIGFYLAFWSLIGKLLVDCINYSYVYEFGELSTHKTGYNHIN